MAAPDFINITNAVDFGTAAGAILALGSLLIVPRVVMWGVRKVLSMLDMGLDEGEVVYVGASGSTYRSAEDRDQFDRT